MDRRRLLPIFMIVFVNILGATLVLPTLPLYTERHFGASPQQVAWLMASFFAAQFLAAPFIGRLSDRYGRLPVLIVSQIGTVISFVMMALAQNMETLFAARILDGITGGNIIVAQAYITDITPRQHRTQSLGFIFASFGLGFAFGPALGGALSAFGSDLLPFVAGAALSLLTVIMTWLMLDESLTPEKRAQRQARGPQSRMTPREVIANAPLLLILLIAFGAIFSLGILQATFALYGQDVLFAGYDERMTDLGIGLLLASVGIGQLITQFVLVKPMVARFGERQMALIGSFVRSAAVLSIAFIVIPWLAAPSLAAFAIGQGIMIPSLQTLATLTVADDQRGGVLGLFQSATNLGVISGLAIGGSLYANHPTTPYLVGGALAFVTAFLTMTLPRRTRTVSEAPA